MAREGIYDALIVDRKLPALDGLTVVRRLRQGDPRTPVLMLSAIATTKDRVEGIRAGCDDYLAKPYVYAELLARLEALARRTDRARGASRQRPQARQQPPRDKQIRRTHRLNPLTQ